MHLAKQMMLSLEFSTQHCKQIALEKRVKELEHDKSHCKVTSKLPKGPLP